jgi:hypothetical protein
MEKWGLGMTVSSENKILSEQRKDNMNNRARKMQSNETSPIFFTILWNKLSWFRILHRLKFDKLVADIRKSWLTFNSIRYSVRPTEKSWLTINSNRYSAAA